MGAIVVEQNILPAPAGNQTQVTGSTGKHSTRLSGVYRKAVEVYLYIPRPCHINKVSQKVYKLWNASKFNGSRESVPFLFYLLY